LGRGDGFEKGCVVDREISPDPFGGLKESSEEYHVYDSHYERIGRVDDVFIDERDAVSYIGVKMGFFGTNSTLVPVELVRVNDIRHLVEVATDAETIKHAPHFGHDDTVSPELEDRVRTYFGLEPLLPPTETYPAEESGSFAPDYRVDIEPGERMEAQEYLAETGSAGAPAAGESPSATPEGRWDRETREDGVIFHRRRG
jgi:hypothetical protein